MLYFFQSFFRRLHQIDVTLSAQIALAANQRHLRSPQYWPALIGAHLGDSWLWAFLAIYMGAYAYIKRVADNGSDLRSVIVWFASIVAGTMITMVIKRWFKRTRPGTGILLYGRGVDGYSFPSGHAVRMGVIVAWSSTLWGNHAWLAWLLAVWVGWSRVRLGIHYVGDVLAGYGVGACLALLIKFLL